MTSLTRGLGKFLIATLLIVGLAVILFLELITPWFVQTQGVRPDLELMSGVEAPLVQAQAVAVEHSIPLAVAAVLCILILIAFWSRLELSRFLRYRVSVPSGIMMALFGGLLCVVAIWSKPDLRQAALSPADALISVDQTVNDLAMNTTYKTLYSLAMPYLNQLTDINSDDVSERQESQ